MAVLAGWQTIKEQAILPLMGLYENRQPAMDERNLVGLRAGMLFSEFQKNLQSHSVAVLYDDIGASPEYSGPLRDELMILPTAYVEAFVDHTQKVVAYTVTARGDKMPVVKTPAGSVHPGITRLTDAPVGSAGIEAVAGVCGAHIFAFYEVTGTNNASLVQTYAYGYTDAGSHPAGYDFPGCPPDSLYDLPSDTSVDHETAESQHYIVDTYLATPDFLADTSSYRSGLVINAVTVTAPAVPLLSQMISLHPDTVAALDPSK